MTDHDIPWRKQTSTDIVFQQVIEHNISVAGGSYIPFGGPERARPLVKSYSLRIARDLQRFACSLVMAGAVWWGESLATAWGALTPGEGDALGRAAPVFAIILLLGLNRRRSDVTARPTAAVAGWAALAWLVAMTATAQGEFALGTFGALTGLSMVLVVGGATIVNAALDAALGSRFVWPHLARNVAIYGVCDDTGRVHGEIARSYGMQYAGLFEDRRNSDRSRASEMAIDGDSTMLIDLISRGKVDEVVITLPAVAIQRIAQISRQLQQFPVDVHLCTNVQGSDVVGGQNGSELPVTRIGSAHMTRVQSRPIREWGVILKALEDGLIASAMLVVLAPVFLLIAIAIKLDSRGPVFFRQRRHGFCGQSIMVWKFRSMRVLENGAVVQQATKRDPRVTAVGRVLRATSLDELPQLLNVMAGEMSLVGPRPHAVAHDEYYAGLIETYAGRHRVKPGITGWAQINGLRGETQTPEQMAKRVEYDIWYIQNWSLWLDLKIILLTPVYGLVHKNAY